MTIRRRLRHSTALAVVMLLIGGTGVLAQVLDEVGNRTHQFKQVAGAESETLPGTRIHDALCEGGTAATTDAEGTEYSFACDGLDLLTFVPSAEMVTIRDGLTGCGLDILLAPSPEALEEAGCLAEDTGISDIWGWTSPETGDEYIIFGKINGVAFYNISDPADPQYYGEIPNLSGQLLWFDIKVNDDVMYAVSESVGYGVVTFDMTQLDSMDPAPAEYFPLAESSRFFPSANGASESVPEQTPTDTSNHNVVIDTDSEVLYLVGGNSALVAGGVCAGGFYAMDISAETGDPFDPPFLGCAEAEGEETRTNSQDVQEVDDTIYVHDAQCTTYIGPDADHQGKPICIGSNEEIVTFLDMTDLIDGDPETVWDIDDEISRVAYPDASYSHQGWMDEQQRYYFNGDELDELYDSDVPNTRTIVIDMIDLDNPFVEALYDHDTVAIDHNMYSHDGLLYQSNYTAGLRVFDIEQSVLTFDGVSVGPKTETVPEEEDDGGTLPLGGDQQAEGAVAAAAVAGEERLVETMFFDTFPDDDEDPVTEFSGTWSNYPYFESGVIPVTGIGDGFFLLRPSSLRPAEETTDPAPTDGETEQPVASDDPEVGDEDLAATGGGAAALLLGGVLLTAAVVLRRRDEATAG